MGYGDVTGAGNPYVRTPHLDRLARSGVQFSNFYVSSVCAPTRASLLTGRYHQRAGVRSVTNGHETMDPSEKTIAEYLKPRGYRTAIFGKWHLGEYYPSLPNAQGFDEFLGFRTGHTADYYDPVLDHNGREVQQQGYITDLLTEKALQFMAADPSEPFFCYLAYNAPHTPLQVDSSWWQPYAAQGLDERTARIYGMIEYIDANIGKIVDQLTEAQRLEETIIIFMSDNGPISGWRLPQEELRYNAGLRDQKFSIYDGGIRTQSYWSWAGHWPAGRTLSQVAAHIDVLPTLLEVIGQAPDRDKKIMDGISLQACLSGKTSEPNDRIFFQNFELSTLDQLVGYPGGIARQGPWKMVNGEYLYHLENDIGETQNLAEQQPEIFHRLDRAYRAWWDEIVKNDSLKVPPVPVGYAEADSVAIQPHHAKAAGDLVFLGRRGLLGERTGSHPSGVDGDWLSNWQQKTDRADWQIEVVESGNYEIGLNARYQKNEAPIALQVQIGADQLMHQLPTAEASENWKYYPLGQSLLTAGKYPLSLQLKNDLPPNVSFEVKEIVIKKL